jgi:hypothetical protein
MLKFCILTTFIYNDVTYKSYPKHEQHIDLTKSQTKNRNPVYTGQDA